MDIVNVVNKKYYIKLGALKLEYEIINITYIGLVPEHLNPNKLHKHYHITVLPLPDEYDDEHTLLIESERKLYNEVYVKTYYK